MNSVGEILGNLLALELEAVSMLMLKADADKIDAAVSQVALSWSGSTLGHHAEMYFERFRRPPRGFRFNAEWGTEMGWPHGWSIPTVEEIEAEIRRISTVDLAAWKQQYKAMLLKLRDLRNALIVEIPNRTAYADPRFARIVSDIEAANFDDSRVKVYLRQVINAHRASVSRDLRAITAGGVTVPTHLHYEALVAGLKFAQESLDELIKNTRLLARYIEIHEESNTAKRNAEARRIMQDLADDPLILRKADGTIRNFGGRVSGDRLITFESTLPCAEGDTVERELPNGQTDRFEILDTGFQTGDRPIDPHYRMKIRKITGRDASIAGSGSVTNIYNVHGPNARFNSQSVDQSHNVVRVDEGELFQKLKEAIQVTSVDGTQREQLLLAVDAMNTHSGKSTFGEKFQSFMALASNCMTVVTPFLPALANLAASAHH